MLCVLPCFVRIACNKDCMSPDTVKVSEFFTIGKL